MNDELRLTDEQRRQLMQIYGIRKKEIHADETVDVEIGDVVLSDNTVSIRVTRTAYVKVPADWVPYKRG